MNKQLEVQAPKNGQNIDNFLMIYEALLSDSAEKYEIPNGQNAFARRMPQPAYDIGVEIFYQ